MTVPSPVERSNTGFQPLAPLLQAINHERLTAARWRVAELGREKLIDGYRDAFASGKRVSAFVLSDELTIRGIPPCFRLDHRFPEPATPEQRFDLFLADIRWLRHKYPDHAKTIRYRRCKEMLTGTETRHHAETEYAFWEGKRPTWKIVASLSLDQRQQFDCALLRSAPVKKRNAETEAMCEQVFKALQDDLRAVRRTSAFTDVDAHAALLRRHRLWLCSRMVIDGSPTEIARRFWQATGDEISRQTVAKQLEKIDEALKKKRSGFKLKERGEIE